MDTKKYIILITSARGPAECCLVVAKVLKFFIKDAKAFGLQAEVIQREKGPEPGTLSSVTVSLSGEKIRSFISLWEGTLQWIGKSPYRKFHGRKNWFIGVKSFALNESEEMKLKDVEIHAFRSGGPGGQHVNKVSTAIRAIHVPTGLSVVAQNSRSQLQNKKEALRRLGELYSQSLMERTVEQQKEIWSGHNTLIRGNPVRVYKGTDFKYIEKRE